MAKKQNKIIRLVVATLILLFLLVILPFGSWYYLKDGLDYRVTTMGELKKYGTLPEFTYPTFVNTSIAAADLKDKVVVANVLDLQDEQWSRTFGSILEKLHDQFNERKDVLFLIHVTDTSKTNVDNFAKQYQLDDYAQCYFIPTDPSALAAVQSNYHLAVDSLYSNFTLIDTKQMVRKHYNAQDEAQVKRLVEHMALLLPLQKREEPTIKREREK
jgi:hypothetical protein